MSKELPKSFIGRGEVKGFEFSQRFASPRGFLYQVTYGTAVWYEVFYRKTVIYFGETYPKAKSFGKWAWSFFNKEKAIEKFNSL